MRARRISFFPKRLLNVLNGQAIFEKPPTWRRFARFRLFNTRKKRPDCPCRLIFEARLGCADAPLTLGRDYKI